ncbi:MAG: DUF4199 domain-containing protein [Taibaiella sp.]|nr:DUF4199 domain-containing protein [Taibaiella sp.]
MKNTHIMYGFLTALAMIILGVLLYVTGNAFSKGGQYLNYVPYIAGILINAIAFSKANGHNVTFGNVFSSCFKMSAIITLVMLVWSFIFMALFPQMMEKGLETARASMEAKNMTAEQIDQAMKFGTNKIFIAFILIFSNMFQGLIFSLIGAAIAKKNPQQPKVQAL